MEEEMVAKEKQRLEFWAIHKFIRAFTKLDNRELTFVRLQKPPKPDSLCLLNRKEIDIEVAHLYGSQRDARMVLGRSKPIEHTKESRIAHSLVPLNDKITSDLNRILKDKAQKKWGNETWLLIRNAFPIWEKEDFLMFKEEISVPVKHPYKEIWLLCDRDGSSGILRLFP